MSQALYRKYRSRSLDEIVGHDQVKSLLKSAVSSGLISHAYLLTGPRGVGKTSIARILAHEINNLPYTGENNNLDIIEIDAASNNGVDDVRDLREKVHIAPTMASKKVYIIDEVHMLSKPAFNALLKTLEEPPSHIVFILATTDSDKLPATILSRVQRLNLRNIRSDDMIDHLKFIAQEESIKIDDAAIREIAVLSEGSFRDAISLIDQMRHLQKSDGKSVTIDDIRAITGTADEETVQGLIEAYRDGNLEKAVKLINQLESSGRDPGAVTKQVIDRLYQGVLSHREDIQVVQNLLDVSKSSYPYIRLLTTLFERQNTESHVAPVEMPLTEEKVVKKPEAYAPATDVKKQKQHKTVSDSEKRTDKFDDKSLLGAIEDDVALRTLLKKCGFSLEGKTLSIFAGSKFNAERLQSAKQQPKLHAALESMGYSDINLNIIARPKPLADAESEAIAAIMGGVEEVTI